MKIGIIGTGNMGRSLGILFAEQGHQLLFGARNLEKAQAAAALAGRGAAAGSNDDAAAFGDVLVWGIRDVPAVEVLKNLSSVAGKPVIDMNNTPGQKEAGARSSTLSVAERLQAELPGAKVVKAFNTFPSEVFELAPSPLADYNVSVFLASDDAAAKDVVGRLAASIGCVPVDCGGLKNAGVLEGVADLTRLLIGMGHPMTVTISARDLPAPAGQRLGGRQPSALK